jgi:hypothetical protein
VVPALRDIEPMGVVVLELRMPELAGASLAGTFAEQHHQRWRRLVVMTNGAVTPKNEAFLSREDMVVNTPVSRTPLKVSLTRAGARIMKVSSRLWGAALLLALLTSAGCAARGRSRAAAATGWPWAVADSVADSVRTEVLSPAVRLHTLVSLAAPWRAAVLDIDLAACVSVRALKGGESAVGRHTTSTLLASVAPGDRPLAAVNADFFLFAPPGVPTGAHVEDGRLITGPGLRPVLAFDGAGQPWLGVLTVRGELRGRYGTVALGSWNRPDLPSVGVLDAAWGSAPDSTVGGRWRLRPLQGAAPSPRSLAGWSAPFVLDTSGTVRAAAGDTLLLVRVPSADSARWRAGDTVTVALRVGPVTPVNVVGGFPMLLTDGALAAGVETAGAASFRGLNPRTAVGLGVGGRRLLLAVIDGRQPGWSVGMTTLETARLMRALGADHALNLDGGGSSAMAVWDEARGAPRVVLRPSDPTGERAVGNALVLLDRCAR